MRMKRLLGTATAAAVLLTGPLSAAALAEEPAAAPPTGVGSGLVRSTLLGVDLGDLINLDILDDESLSTIDPVNGEPVSSAVLNPVKLTSSVLGPLSLGTVATSTTGAEDRKSVDANTAGNIPLPVVSGLLSGDLSSIVDGEGARSSLLAGIGGGLDLVGGLIDLGKTPEAMTFTTSAAPARAEGLRGLNIPSLSLLNLGDLLEGLGLPLADMPLTDLTGLLEGLGIDSVLVGDDVLSTSEITEIVDGLVGGLDVLEAVPTDELDLPLTDTLCGKLEGTVGGALGGVLGGGGLGDDESCDTALDADGGVPVVGNLLENVDVLLEDILEGVLPTLDGLNLLEVRDIKAGMVATATDSLDSSVADVVASIGSIKVANLDILDNIDLTKDLKVLSGLGDTISNLLNTGLGLGDLLDIDVLKIEELVAPDGDYTKALSSLTALGVGLKPLSLVGIASSHDEPTARGILGNVPLLGGADMLNLEGLLGGATSVLTKGLDIKVGHMASEGFFTPVAALTPNLVDPPKAPKASTTPDGKLPRTGGGSTVPAVLAVMLATTAVVIRRTVRTEKVDR